MNAASAYVFSKEFYSYDYGPGHPLRVERLKLTHELIQAYGLLNLPNQILEDAAPGSAKSLESFHRPEYLDLLRRASRQEIQPEEGAGFGLGSGDNPIFPGLWEWSVLAAGASVQAARLVAEGRASVAFSPAGGMHHAMPCRASGFCYLNDVVAAIQELLSRNLRVCCVDVDAHHGDGVQEAFYSTDRVLTISLHQHGKSLFPGTGSVYETGRGRGEGFSVNLPLWRGTDDDLYWEVFNETVPELVDAFRPDILVTQLGVDTLRTDPLTGLCLTTNGFEAVVKAFKGMNLPWVALGGGGYHIVNVARAWTLAWAVMNDVTPPDELPEAFIKTIRPWGYADTWLRDSLYRVERHARDEAVTTARQAVETIRKMVLPVIKANTARILR